MNIPYSQRLPWTHPDNRLAMAIAERRRKGGELLDLTVSNPTAVGLPLPDGDWVSAASGSDGMLYTPEPRGLLQAREAIAGYYADRGIAVSVDDLCMTNSTSEAYAHLFRLLADPGHEFLVSRPTYPLFDFLAGLEGVRLKPYDLYYDGSWHLDVASIEEAITPATRGIVLVNPNNPTGSFLRAGDWSRLAELAATRCLPLIVDEVFGDFAIEPEADAVLSLAGERRAPVVVLSGLSKIGGLPQVKIGWALAAGPDSFRYDVMDRMELVADTFLSVAQPMQAAVPAWLAGRHRFQEACLQRLRENLGILRRDLTGTSIQLLPVEGGWYAVLRLPAIRTDEEWALELLGAGVICHPGYLFDFPGEAYVVVSLLSPPERCARAMVEFRNFGKMAE